MRAEGEVEREVLVPLLPCPFDVDAMTVGLGRDRWDSGFVLRVEVK